MAQDGESQSSTARKSDPDDHKKKCPDCDKYINLEAQVCRHCGHEFSDKEVEQQVEEDRREVEDMAVKSEGEFYCQQTEKAVDPKSDGYTCPACGSGIRDGSHPPREEV